MICWIGCQLVQTTGQFSDLFEKVHFLVCTGDAQCPPEYLKCEEGHCIPLERICDGSFDCINRVDEFDCGK